MGAPNAKPQAFAWNMGTMHSTQVEDDRVGRVREAQLQGVQEVAPAPHGSQGQGCCCLVVTQAPAGQHVTQGLASGRHASEHGEQCCTACLYACGAYGHIHVQRKDVRAHAQGWGRVVSPLGVCDALHTHQIPHQVHGMGGTHSEHVSSWYERQDSDCRREGQISP